MPSRAIDAEHDVKSQRAPAIHAQRGRGKEDRLHAKILRFLGVVDMFPLWIGKLSRCSFCEKGKIDPLH